jgi:hypothetical protein
MVFGNGVASVFAMTGRATTRQEKEKKEDGRWKMEETAEAVRLLCCSTFTPLKRGVNEARRVLTRFT